MIKIGTHEVNAPEKECSDKNCPFHGTLSIRGRSFEGVVKSDKMQRTVSVVWNRIVKIPKYNRYMIEKSKVNAHNPGCVNAKAGDKVLISECRPLSKTKKFVVLKVVSDE